MTPLDLSHLKVFLGIFWEFFIFLNSNLNFEFGPVWYWPKPEPNRSGHRFCKPCGAYDMESDYCIYKYRAWRGGGIFQSKQVRAGTQPAQIQNSNLNSKNKKIPKKFLKILQGATNLMVSNFLKNLFV